MEKVIENMNLIRKLAWSFHKTTGVDIEELISEGTLAYLESQKFYENRENPPNGWFIIRNALINFTKSQKTHSYSRTYTDKYSTQDSLKKSVNTEFLISPVTQPHFFFELYDTFPDDCKIIANLILENPQKFLQYPPKLARGELVKILRAKKWPWEKIWKNMRVLKNILNENQESCLLYWDAKKEYAHPLIDFEF